MTTRSSRRRTRTRSRRSQRGITLLESLLAFVILATGTLSVAALQGQIRLHADLARQRSEAVRLGQQEIEQLRALPFAAAASGAPSYASMADADRTVDRASGFDSNTAYRVARRIDATSVRGGKAVSVAVAWSDRAGGDQRIVLATVIAGVDPAYSAALGLGGGAGLPIGGMHPPP